MTASVQPIPRRSSIAENLATLALSVLISMIIDSVLISAAFAVASNFVEGMSADAGVVGVMFMVLSLVVIWPLVLVPLIVLLLMGDLVRRVPAWVFVVCFSAAVTASFVTFLYSIIGGRWGLALFLRDATVLVDIGVAGLVSSTFAVSYRMMSTRRRR